MSKHGGYLTPKAIANRMKAKGLQKLRWYCQMCKKQCRDANGFKCHKTSEGHQRMMKIFRENRSTILDRFSKEFESGFMDLVRRRWRTKRVFANKVYNEYISDRHHIHMNATIWESLSSFVKYLGRTKQCDVDQTEKGWYIKYIDRDPDVIAQQEAIKKKEKMDMDDEMKNRKRIEKMILIKQDSGLPDEAEATEIKRENTETEKIQFKIATPAPSTTTPTTPTTDATTTVNSTPVVPKKLSVFVNDDDEDNDDENNQQNLEKKRKHDEESSERDAKVKKRLIKMSNLNLEVVLSKN